MQRSEAFLDVAARAIAFFAAASFVFSMFMQALHVLTYVHTNREMGTTKYQTQALAL